MYYFDIAIDVPKDNAYTYSSEEELKAGARVLVSFGHQKKVGIVLGSAVLKPEQEISKIKPLLEVIDSEPFVNKSDLEWLKKASDYYCAPIGQVLAQAIPKAFWQVDAKKRNKVLKAKSPLIKAWAESKEPIELTSTQKAIAEQILQHQNEFYPALIQGVTGSGKTEIYIEIIRALLKQNKSVIYLVPEIGLTPQTLGRLFVPFKDQLLVYHSALTDNQRTLQWLAAKTSEPKVLVGTRSAIFAPFSNLGALVIDEEHDASFKQEDRFKYNAKDLALMRAKELGIPVILGSATPSLETYHQAKNKAYAHFVIRERPQGLVLPKVDILNLAQEKEQTQSVLLLSKHIHRQIKKAKENKKQMIVFVGQRGFAQNAFCLSCLKATQCPNCSVGLKYHSFGKILKCHYCDFKKKFDEICLACGEKKLTLLGSGIQAIEKEILEQHPGLSLIRLDSDNLDSNQKLTTHLTDFLNHKADLLLGTQMVTKGHDFPGVDFVAVAGVESQLGLPDFRAAERTFQTLLQVAGRAGRHKTRGLVLIQSYRPEHQSLKWAMAQDFDAFAKDELKMREELFYPPFSRLIQIRLQSPNESRLKNFVKDSSDLCFQLQKKLNLKGIRLLGPTEMPVYKLRGVFRLHYILKMPKGLKTKSVVHFVAQSLGLNDHLKMQVVVDVDPQSLF